MAELAELNALDSDSRAVLAATKLHIPPVRPQHVPRVRLIDALVERPARKVTLIEASAGYGKTTLIAEWASSDKEARDFAWLSLDEGDNDPVRFWAGVIDAIRLLEPGFGERAAAAVAARSIGIVDVALPLLLNELAELEREIVLVLDDYHVVRNEEAHRSVAFLIAHLPSPLHLALATRTEPPLPLARMRAGGELLEVRGNDLRFDDEETAELLRRALDLDLDSTAVSRLRQRTEGWPAGLYLAGLSLRGRPDPDRFIDSFAGNDRHIVDYLSSEVLADQGAELRDFLLRTSILDRLCGPLCDHVAGAEDSTARLVGLESRNLFLVPLDHTRTWYRYHRLFGELLRHELEHAHPGVSGGLHRRAREWFEREGSVAEAIHHGVAGGDLEHARELIAANWNEYFNRGRLGTIRHWLDSLPRPTVTEDARLCVAGAWVALDRGELADARGWIDTATRATSPDPVSSAEADIGVLCAVHGFKVGSLEESQSAAREVIGITDGQQESFARTVAKLILGVALYWNGESEEAGARLPRAAELSKRGANDLGQAYALGYLGLIAADRGDAAEADRLGLAAVELREGAEFREHFVLMAAHLARSRAAEGQGRLDQAEHEASRAVELSRRGAGRLEIGASLLALSRVRQLRGDRDEARHLLRSAREAIDGCADPGGLATAVAAAERGVRVARGPTTRSNVQVEELTDRELAVLRLLASDLSRREIADALYVSQNTIKTHLRGIYRKLDATTRATAVARARELELL